jgi:hypothetical protein
MRCNPNHSLTPTHPRQPNTRRHSAADGLAEGGGGFLLRQCCLCLQMGVLCGSPDQRPERACRCVPSRTMAPKTRTEVPHATTAGTDSFTSCFCRLSISPFFVQVHDRAYAICSKWWRQCDGNALFGDCGRIVHGIQDSGH